MSRPTSHCSRLPAPVVGVPAGVVAACCLVLLACNKGNGEGTVGVAGDAAAGDDVVADGPLDTASPADTGEAPRADATTHDDGPAATDGPPAGGADAPQDDVVDAQPWPPCPDYKMYNDGKEEGGNNCWGPPDQWCSTGGGGALTNACAPDESLCCTFGSTCIPCDWTACSMKEAGDPNDPAPCTYKPPGKDPFPRNGVWNKPACDEVLWTIHKCAICGSDIVCPEK